MTAGRPRGYDIAITVAFTALLLAGLAHHAMWRDEILAWMIALTADTPAALFRALHYDGHPGLWHALLWPVTRLTDEPRALQAVHGVIGLALIALIGLASPFSRTERVLLLGGYFIGFEYTIVSRNYGIGLLLALLYAHRRVRVPAHILTNTALLACLANTNIYAGILAGALALEYAADRWRPTLRPRLVLAAALFTAGLAIAVATVWPAADISREITQPLDAALSPGHFLKTALRFAAIGLAPLRAEPLARQFLLFPPESSEIRELLPYFAAAVVLLATVAATLRGQPRLLVVVALTLAGATVFGHLVYAVAARHWGIVFVAFLACFWMARLRRPGIARWPVLAILGLGAIAGAQAQIMQWSRPFSNATATANWIATSDYATIPLIGIPDTYASAVAALLRRPITMPECDCTARRAVYSTARDGFRRADLPAALARLVPQDALLVSAWSLRATERDAIRAAGLAIDLVFAATGAWAGEDFGVYLLRRVR